MTIKKTGIEGLETTNVGQVEARQWSEKTALTKVTLVIEYGQEPLPLDVLNRFLNPESVELTVAHAEFDWASIQADPAEEAHNFGSSVAEMETVLRDYKARLQDQLTLAGFRIVNEVNSGTRDQNRKALTALLEDTEQDLLVILSTPPQDEHAKASHFAYTLATHAPTSVLMLRRPTTLDAGPISVMMGVDGSEASMNAARKLGEYVDVSQIALEMVTVQSPIYQENAVLAPYVNQEALDEALEVNGNMIFEIVADIVQTQGVPLIERTRILGSPATELGNLAQRKHPDLIVVGSHNRTGVFAWLMGSVSSQLLHWDTHNLLVVK